MGRTLHRRLHPDRYGHLYDDADDSMPDRLDELLAPARSRRPTPAVPLRQESEALQ